MSPVAAVDIDPHWRALDLCAAPGGKSSQLAMAVPEGLLVSNDPVMSRCRILTGNIERMGYRHVVTACLDVSAFSKSCPGYFDLTLADAPCSGEGMFRKDPAAMDYWDKHYPARCAQLQKEILVSALTMLAPGGQLVYSTCTWSPEENEEVVAWLLEEYDLELLPIEKINGMVDGIGYPETARMYPHHFKGEGQFVAKFRYLGQQPSKRIKAGKSNLNREQVQLWQDFSNGHLTVSMKGLLQVFGDQLYLLPEGLPDLSKLRIARNGLHLGTFKKKRFEPSFALGIALISSEVKKRLEIPEEDFGPYVAGNTIAVSKDLSNGWYQVAVQGNGFGFAKVVSGTLKNNFPKGLRFQSI